MITLKSLLTELTHRQKEAKKDYLFRQTKLHSSNTVPPFSDIWKELSKSDGLKHELEARIDSVNDYETPEQMESLIAAQLKEIEANHREKYFEIVEQYKGLSGSWCWRNIVIPSTVDPKTLNQLGIYWSIDEHFSESPWAKDHRGSLQCKYQALIDLSNVDWAGTMFARMDWSGGDDENEIRFLRNAPLMVRKVDVLDSTSHKRQTYFINNRRRA